MMSVVVEAAFVSNWRLFAGRTSAFDAQVPLVEICLLR